MARKYTKVNGLTKVIRARKAVGGYCQELCAKSLQAAERSVVMQWRDR